MKTRYLLLGTLLGLGSFALTEAKAVDTLVYPGLEQSKENVFPEVGRKYDRFKDIKQMLKTALEKTRGQYGPYELKESRQPMTEARYLHELSNGNSINIAWSSNSQEKEKDFLPIRIDLRKGFLGYRICIIHKDSRKKIRQIKTLQQLRALTVGQGIGWEDVAIYEHNKISVIASEYNNLFFLVSQKRIDLYPRGITEVFGEYTAASKLLEGLAIDDHLLIYYQPFPYYFFLNKKDSRLAARVKAGLRLMIKDGSFDKIFWEHNKDAIAKANLKGRTVIKLENPLLPPSAARKTKSVFPGKTQRY